jgi:hypothetical protein
MSGRDREALPYRINRPPVSKLARSTTMLRAGLLSLAVATLIFGFLTLQMASGHDPALGNDLSPSSRNTSSSAPVAPIEPVEPEEQVTPAAPMVQPAPAPLPVQTSTS